MLLMVPDEAQALKGAFVEIGSFVKQRFAHGFAWNSEHLRNLRHFESFIGWINVASTRVNAYLQAANAPSLPIITAPTFSTLGQSLYLPDLHTVDGKPVDVVVIDTRTILETYLLLLISPFAAPNYSKNSVAALLKLLMVSRLNALPIDCGQRYAMGMLVDAFCDHQRDAGSIQWTLSLKHCEERATLPPRDKVSILRALTLFLAYHEYAHALFRRSSRAREVYERNVDATIARYSADYEHRRTHDGEAARFIERRGTLAPHKLLDIDDVITELRRFASGGSLVAAADREEFLADSFAVEMLLLDASLSESLRPRDLAVTRSAILCASAIKSLFRDRRTMYEATDDFVSRFAVQGVTPDAAARATKMREMEDRLQGEMLNYSRVTQIQLLRMKLMLEQFDATVPLLKREALQGTVAYAEDHPEEATAAREIENRYRELELDIFDIANNQIFAVEKIFGMSSAGRGMEHFFSNPNAPQLSRRDLDPFALYVLGYAPHQSAERPVEAQPVPLEHTYPLTTGDWRRRNGRV